GCRALAFRRGERCWVHASQRARSPPRDEGARGRAEEREHETLGEQKANEPSPPRAESEPDGDLAAPRRSTAKQQGREVYRRDEKYEDHRAGEHEQRSPDERGQARVVERPRGRTPTDRAAFPESWKGAVDARAEHRGLVPRALDRHARSAPRHEVEL